MHIRVSQDVPKKFQDVPGATASPLCKRVDEGPTRHDGLVMFHPGVSDITDVKSEKERRLETSKSHEKKWRLILIILHIYYGDYI